MGAKEGDGVPPNHHPSNIPTLSRNNTIKHIYNVVEWKYQGIKLIIIIFNDRNNKKSYSSYTIQTHT